MNNHERQTRANRPNSRANRSKEPTWGDIIKEIGKKAGAIAGIGTVVGGAAIGILNAGEASNVKRDNEKAIANALARRGVIEYKVKYNNSGAEIDFGNGDKVSLEIIKGDVDHSGNLHDYSVGISSIEAKKTNENGKEVTIFVKTENKEGMTYNEAFDSVGYPKQEDDDTKLDAITTNEINKDVVE